MYSDDLIVTNPKTRFILCSYSLGRRGLHSPGWLAPARAGPAARERRASPRTRPGLCRTSGAENGLSLPRKQQTIVLVSFFMIMMFVCLKSSL